MKCSICDNKTKITHDFLCHSCFEEYNHRKSVMCNILLKENKELEKIIRSKRFLERHGYKVEKI